ncbi:MAG: competence/damage-inducible protein, partial [Bacilli bacterium]|nr:competence/damage-inducible protein [Bacilli bacterium]
MRAEIIGVGTELLLGQIANTNAQYLSSELALEGVGVYYHQVVGDNKERLHSVLSLAKSRSDMVLLTGGLGPTEDDLTREVLAEFIKRPLAIDAGQLLALESYFVSRGRTMTENNRKQAMLIEGASFLPNPRGTAPGMYVESEGVHYFLMPGPPTEMRGMYQEQIVPRIRAIFGSQNTIRSKVLRIVGIGESAMEAMIQDILHAQENPTVAPYASEGEVSLRITAKAESEQQAFDLIAPVEARLKERLGNHIYGVDQATLSSVVGDLLVQAGQTLSVAESCTGGMLGVYLTDIPGSSRYFTNGFITYSNEAKQKHLGVTSEVLANFGAVSEECAKAMAEGARRSSESDWAVSITGIAGPGGGTTDKPVGLVYVGVAGPGGTSVRELRHRGDRNQIRIRSVKSALSL